MKGENTMKTLVAYFSASGVTAKLAERLAAAINAPVYEIRPETPYSAADLDWTNKQSRSTLEMRDKSCRPGLADRNAPVEEADVVFVGYPVWWYREPSIIDSFLAAYDFTGKKEDIERVKKSLEKSIEKCENQINIETDNQRKWNRLSHKVDEILNDYPILQVKLRGEKLHSSMLFLRNRYYRAIYEIIKSHPMIHVYKSINSMPIQKLYTLYEKWCYFKMISIIMEKYGFDIYAFSNIQGQLTEENLRFDESLAILIQSAISDIPCPANDYINIILKL